MKIRHTCGEEQDVPDHMAGKKVRCSSCSQEFEVPPVDLTRPIENPSLVEAIEAHAGGPDPRSLRALLEEILKSTLLMAIRTDRPQGDAGDATSMEKLEKGATIQILHVTNDQGLKLLALFSDWEQLNAFGQGFDASVAAAKQALNFALSQGYDGLVINPGGSAVELHTPHIKALLAGDLPPG
jgi:hypothetical protein